MEKPKEKTSAYSENDIIAMATQVSDGVWIKGFYVDYAFEAKINYEPQKGGINDGHITHLTVTGYCYSEDNSLKAEIASYCGKWYMRPWNVASAEKVDKLIALLSESSHKKPKQKQTA